MSKELCPIRIEVEPRGCVAAEHKREITDLSKKCASALGTAIKSDPNTKVGVARIGDYVTSIDRFTRAQVSTTLLAKRTLAILGWARPLIPQNNTHALELT